MPTYVLECIHCKEQEEIVLPLSEHGNWPSHCGKQMRSVIQAPMTIRGDIEPFQSVVTDIATGRLPVISSRKQLKEFEKRNGVHQVGTDVKAIPKPFVPPPKVRNDLGRVVHQVLSKGKK